jgi:hypothetical protein
LHADIAIAQLLLGNVSDNVSHPQTMIGRPSSIMKQSMQRLDLREFSSGGSIDQLLGS